MYLLACKAALYLLPLVIHPCFEICMQLANLITKIDNEAFQGPERTASEVSLGY